MNDNDPRKPLIDLIRKHGLDPDWVAADELSEDGYFAYVREDAGTTRRRMGDNSTTKKWVAWPPALVAEPDFPTALRRAIAHIYSWSIRFPKEES